MELIYLQYLLYFFAIALTIYISLGVNEINAIRGVVFLSAIFGLLHFTNQNYILFPVFILFPLLIFLNKNQIHNFVKSTNLKKSGTLKDLGIFLSLTPVLLLWQLKITTTFESLIFLFIFNTAMFFISQKQNLLLISIQILIMIFAASGFFQVTSASSEFYILYAFYIWLLFSFIFTIIKLLIFYHNKYSDFDTSRLRILRG